MLGSSIFSTKTSAIFGLDLRWSSFYYRHVKYFSFGGIMALIKCKECGKEISKKAETCPHCGAPLKKQPTQYGCGTLLLVGFIVIIFVSTFSSNEPSAPPKPKTSEEIRKERIEKGFSAWDGSHRALTKIIKKSMNDPDSYEHEETVYWDKGDHLIVRTTFRGKNAFGGVVKNSVMAKVDLDGNVLEILSQGP